MKLVVCGDSFFSCDERYPGTHFSELLANQLGCELVNLAREGISNSGIRLQVDRALTFNPSFIIVGATSSDRFEMPLKSLWPNESRGNFDAHNGLDNVAYNYYNSTAKQYLDQQKATLFSNHYSKFASDNNFDSTFNLAWKYFFDTILDLNWKQQQDNWIIESSLVTLLNQPCPFLYIPNAHYVPAWLDRSLVADEQQLTNLTGHCDSIYHTTAENQQIFYNYIKDRINYGHTN